MGERNADWLPFIQALTGNQTCSLGMFPDRESNSPPFRLWTIVHPTEPRWPGLVLISQFRS